MLHLPILRRGVPYRSIDTIRTVHHRTREPLVEISVANSGLIRRDLLNQERVLDRFTMAELIDICHRAADHFANDALPLGDTTQSPQDYVEQVSATTGLPHVMVRRNMDKIRGVMAYIEDVLTGLSRGLDLSVLDRGHGEVQGTAVSFFPRGNTLGVILPSNSPGVHALWVPAIALKTALVLKPGSSEPWSPYRVIGGIVAEGFGRRRDPPPHGSRHALR
jgi:acyl-CoA reductase-like NAD-dependent aldehyde dehydrogenase